MVDLPKARLAGEESEVIRAADGQRFCRSDLDRARAAANLAGVPAIRATESGRGETAVAEMLGSRVNWPMLIAGGAVDRRLEPERGELAERRER
jgi:hypothetical protein